MGKARITYRFDNETQKKPTEAEFVQRDRLENPTRVEHPARATDNVIPLYQEDSNLTTRDYGSWNSPFDVETERIEQLIRKSEMNKEYTQHSNPYRDQSTPTSYTAPQAEESFHSVNFYDEAPIRPTYRKRGKSTNWFSVTTAITGAILTGIVLGMFVLSMFKGDVAPSPNPNETPVVDNEPQVVLKGTEETTTNADNKDISTGADVNLSPTLLSTTVPEQTYYLIQNGVFSSVEGANTAVQMLKDMGLSGAISQTEQFTVFAGAAVAHDDALLLSHYLQSNGLEVFIKTYVLPAVQQLSWAGDDGNQIKGYLDNSRSLVNLILTITSVGLQDSTATKLSDSDRQLVQQQHKLWTESANQLATDAHEDVRTLVQQMNKSLNSAVITLEQYDKNPTEVYLWQAQAAVADHIIAEKQFIDFTKAQ